VTNTAVFDFAAWSQQALLFTENQLNLVLPTPQTAPAQLHSAMRYAVLDGGKRVRPLLAYAAGKVFDATFEQTWAVACSIELIHAYSLVHDDMPCMDDDSLRRGKPTVHVAFGQANALLVGDSLQPLAFNVLAQIKHLPNDRVVELVRCLADGSGSLGMAGGQAIDLGAVGTTMDRAQLEQMHAMKTGALLRAAVLMGSLCGQQYPDPSQTRALNIYARAVGLAFQVVDDILDVSADTFTLGKTAGKDAQNNKPTFVSLMGLEGARQLARQLHAQAYEALTVFNEKAAALGAIADMIIARKS
jgi:farnesyl diphosphate synthase